jgi:hypothetical protein
MYPVNSNITDYDIEALIDNELDWEREKEVRRAIKNNSTHLKKYRELLLQKKLVQKWFQIASE